MDPVSSAAVTSPGPASATGEIRFDAVTKRYGEATVIDDLSLTIEPGTFYALLGPSGCGKTTTLRMIGGFEVPTEGKVYLDGADVSLLPPNKRDVNTVFQSYALFPHLTVLKNVMFGLERRGVAKAEVRRRATEALESVELGHLAERKPMALSVASSSASRSPGRWSTARTRCCSTSRWVPSICACAASCRSRSSACTPSSGSRSCTSRTTRRRR